jgi:hypothetical protein
MAEGGEEPAGSSKREADYLERRHQAASSPSIMDMSEDKLNEAIAAINRRLETSAKNIFQGTDNEYMEF